MKKLMKSLLSLSMFLAMTACSSADNLQLSKTDVTLEYGDALSLEPKEYLAEDTSEDILKDTKVEVFVVEDDQKAEDPIDTDGTDLAVGSYVLSLIYNDETEDVNVIVEDTKAPEFVDFTDEISIEQGTADVALENLFKVGDASSVEITVEGDVDFNTAGTYPVKVVAKDEYDNSTEKDCNIVITEKEVVANTPNTSGGSSSSSNSNSSSSGSNSSNTGSSNNTGSTGGSTGSSGSSGSSNTGSSGSGGSTTTPPSQPSQPEPTPEPHEHKFIVNSTTTYYEGNELLFDNWDDCVAKADELQAHHWEQEYLDKYGYWKNISGFGVRCANGCGELWYAVELTY